jgi:transposase
MAMLKALDRAHRFLDDGRICLSNNAAEWAVRGIAMTDSFCTSFSSV